MNNLGMFNILFPNIDFSKLKMNEIDSLGKEDFVSFIFLLVEQLDKNIIKNILTKFRLPVKDIQFIVEMKQVLSLKEITKKDIVIFNNSKKSEDSIFDSIDFVLSMRDNNTSINNELRVLREKGIPTNLKELTINVEDLIKKGFKGKEIGIELNRLLLKGVL